MGPWEPKAKQGLADVTEHALKHTSGPDGSFSAQLLVSLEQVHLCQKLLDAFLIPVRCLQG